MVRLCFMGSPLFRKLLTVPAGSMLNADSALSCSDCCVSFSCTTPTLSCSVSRYLASRSPSARSVTRRDSWTFSQAKVHQSQEDQVTRQLLYRRPSRRSGPLARIQLSIARLFIREQTVRLVHSYNSVDGRNVPTTYSIHCQQQSQRRCVWGRLERWTSRHTQLRRDHRFGMPVALAVQRSARGLPRCSGRPSIGCHTTRRTAFRHTRSPRHYMEGPQPITRVYSRPRGDELVQLSFLVAALQHSHAQIRQRGLRTLIDLKGGPFINAGLSYPRCALVEFPTHGCV